MARRAEFRNEVKTRLRDRAYEARWAAGSSRAPTSAATRWCRSWSSASSMPTRRRRPPSGTTSAVIREFLVALGFKVDEKGLKNFNAGVEQATKGVIRLVSTIQGAALSVGAGVSAFASKLERLYFVSQRTGAAATSLKAFEYSHAFMIALRDLGTTFENFGVRVQRALLHKVGPQLERFKRWFDENSPAIADRVAKIAEAVLSAAAAMGPPIGWIVDRFIELDGLTDGWSTKILLLIGAFKVLGGFQIISGIWKMVAAVRALGAANAAAAAAGAAGAGAGGAAAGGAAGILSRFLPWLAKAGGAAALLFHSGRLNDGEEAELARRRASAQGQGSLADTPFGRLIASGEGDYNSVNRGAKGGYKAGTENLEGMTVAEVMRAQQEGQFNAAGRYQIIKTTLADAVKKLGLTGSEKFDRGLQDRIFSEYLVGSKRSAIKDYLTGASDNIVAAMQAAAREWASVADPATGKSFYDGVGNNRASISVEQLEQALRNTRAAMTATPTVYAQRAPGGNSVQLEQRTEINVYGVNDAAAAGREVSREQGRLNGDLVRNLQGAVS